MARGRDNGEESGSLRYFFFIERDQRTFGGVIICGGGVETVKPVEFHLKRYESGVFWRGDVR
jgi:hypothetical protein